VNTKKDRSISVFQFEMRERGGVMGMVGTQARLTEEGVDKVMGWGGGATKEQDLTHSKLLYEHLIK
jgi:hypothetical protein